MALSLGAILVSILTLISACTGLSFKDVFEVMLRPSDG